MLDDVKNGQVDGIVCWHNDRLHRQQRELEDFIELVDQAAIPVQTVTAGIFNLSDASGRMTARILGAVARQESEHKAERQRAKHDELAAQGSPSGGTRPFGLTEVKDGPDGRSYREEVPEEADAIREAARDIIAGTLVREICHTMRADIVIAAEPPVSLRAGILTVTTKPGSLITGTAKVTRLAAMGPTVSVACSLNGARHTLVESSWYARFSSTSLRAKTQLSGTLSTPTTAASVITQITLH